MASRMKIAHGNQAIQSKHLGSQNNCGAGPPREGLPLAALAQNQEIELPQMAGTPFQPGLSLPTGILAPGPLFPSPAF